GRAPGRGRPWWPLPASPAVGFRCLWNVLPTGRGSVWWMPVVGGFVARDLSSWIRISNRHWLLSCVTPDSLTHKKRIKDLGWAQNCAICPPSERRSDPWDITRGTTLEIQKKEEKKQESCPPLYNSLSRHRR
ncbi:unnamed protein product, partial [Ixodes pacificus]